jgi:5'-nucleotidase
VRVDEAFFMGGVDKTPILQAFKPHIYFDDQVGHCERAACVVPTARVPVFLAPSDSNPENASNVAAQSV